MPSFDRRDKVDEAASAVRHESDAVLQVTQILGVVQTNSAASEELASQAQILKNVVNQFRLPDGRSDALFGGSLSQMQDSISREKSLF